MPITEALAEALGNTRSEGFDSQLRDFQGFQEMLESAGVRLSQEGYDIPLINRMGHLPEPRLCPSPCMQGLEGFTR